LQKNSEAASGDADPQGFHQKISELESQLDNAAKESQEIVVDYERKLEEFAATAEESRTKVKVCKEKIEELENLIAQQKASAQAAQEFFMKDLNIVTEELAKQKENAAKTVAELESLSAAKSL